MILASLIRQFGGFLSPIQENSSWQCEFLNISQAREKQKNGLRPDLLVGVWENWKLAVNTDQCLFLLSLMCDHSLPKGWHKSWQERTFLLSHNCNPLFIVWGKWTLTCNKTVILRWSTAVFTCAQWLRAQSCGFNSHIRFPYDFLFQLGHKNYTRVGTAILILIQEWNYLLRVTAVAGEKES